MFYMLCKFSGVFHKQPRGIFFLEALDHTLERLEKSACSVEKKNKKGWT